MDVSVSATAARPTAAVSAESPETVNVETTVNRFPSAAELQGIAEGLRSFVPLLRQLVEAQSKLGGNAAASVVRLSSDAPRIAELTATILDEEARSNNARRPVVEQCLRVGNMILLTALELIKFLVLTVDGTLFVDALTDPEKGHQHAQHIVDTIERVLPLFGQ
jgi:hypothetical protein